MTTNKISPACIHCRFSASYAPIRPNEQATLRYVRYAPHAKLFNTESLNAYEHFVPNYPVVVEKMFCGEFEAK